MKTREEAATKNFESPGRISGGFFYFTAYLHDYYWQCWVLGDFNIVLEDRDSFYVPKSFQ